ncbi:MAG: TonB family protein [Terracidiphilus sp.]|jgi:TonB family protein
MSSGSIGSDWVGRVVDGKFALLQWLGPSDFGGVFLAELDGLPWKQADVEFIPADAEDAEALTAAWELAAPLSHPHLIRLIDSGRCTIDTSFLIYAITEHPEEVLSEILPQRPLTPTEAGEALVSIVDALVYLHDCGIVHGHLKPENILVVEDRVKLSSRRLYKAGEPAWYTATRHVYDAPETGNEPMSPASDVWSLGVTLVEALTQYPVWDRTIDGEPVVPASIPDPFHTIARECLRTDPTRRCTLGDIKARLEQFAPAITVTESVLTEQDMTDPTPAEATAEKHAAIAIPARHRGPAMLAALFFLVALTLTLVVHSHHVQPTSPSTGQGPLPAGKTTLPASQPALSARPGPQRSAPVQGNQTSTKGATTGEVAERAMPDLLPNAVQSIRGQVNVTVRVSVDAGGKVESASLDSPGPSKYFAKMSLEAAQNWKFKPAQAPSAWLLHFTFTQAGTEITPVQESL